MSSTMICLPLDMAKGRRIPGSIESTCARCQTSISIAPSGQALLREGKIGEVRCLRCAPHQLEILPMTPEQQAELPWATPALWRQMSVEMIGLTAGLPLGAKRGQA